MIELLNLILNIISGSQADIIEEDALGI